MQKSTKNNIITPVYHPELGVVDILLSYLSQVFFFFFSFLQWPSSLASCSLSPLLRGNPQHALFNVSLSYLNRFANE